MDYKKYLKKLIDISSNSNNNIDSRMLILTEFQEEVWKNSKLSTCGLGELTSKKIFDILFNDAVLYSEYGDFEDIHSIYKRYERLILKSFKIYYEENVL